jgi:RHS repeat-associated protein
VRVGQTTGGVTTSYLWDRPANGSPRTGCSCNQANGAPLPLLVDDGFKAYLQDDGLLAEIDGSNVADYPMTDALGSVRGLTDGAGVVSGTADYAVFGAIPATTGATSGFGFTGDQRDTPTGFTFLRARYLDPGTGRFTAADSVQPNAPGTQGWGLYAYAAGNPTTVTDPSGRSAFGNVASCMLFALSTIAFFVGALAVYGMQRTSTALVAMYTTWAATILAIAACLVLIIDYAMSMSSGSPSAEGPNPSWHAGTGDSPPTAPSTFPSMPSVSGVS